MLCPMFSRPCRRIRAATSTASFCAARRPSSSAGCDHFGCQREIFSLQVRDETSLKRDVWESAGEDNLRGRFLMRLKTAFDEAKTDAEREKITQAARWGLAALDNREEVVRHDD